MLWGHSDKACVDNLIITFAQSTLAAEVRFEMHWILHVRHAQFTKRIGQSSDRVLYNSSSWLAIASVLAILLSFHHGYYRFFYECLFLVRCSRSHTAAESLGGSSLADGSHFSEPRRTSHVPGSGALLPPVRPRAAPLAVLPDSMAQQRAQLAANWPQVHCGYGDPQASFLLCGNCGAKLS